VHKQTRPVRRFFAAVFFALLATAVSEDRPGAQTTTTATWTAADVGSPTISGAAQSNPNCTVTTGCPLFTVSGAGDGMGGSADQFAFLYQRLTGDGAVTMRLLSLAGGGNPEAGLTFRETLDPGARHGSFVVGGSSLTLRRRTSPDDVTSESTMPRPSVSFWMKLERAGSVLTASTSTDGSEWAIVGAQTVTMQATVYVGIVVTSRNALAAATATVSSTSVTSTTPSLPEGWSSANVGRFTKPGSASYSDGTFVGTSSATGIRSNADAFRFVYYRTRGDVKLVARVAASVGPKGRQVGITLRNTLDAGAVQETLFVDDAGIGLVRRTAGSANAVTTRHASRVAPLMLRLERTGSTVVSSYSTNGGDTWRTIRIDTMPLSADLYVGMAVAGGLNETSAAGAFENVSLVSVAANRAPTVSVTSPALGAVIRQGTTVPVTAAASDPDDRVVRVEFRVNGTLIGTDTTAPFAASWIAGITGLYSLTATAVDDDAASTTSLPVVVTTVPPLLPPPDGDSETPDDPPPPPPPTGTGPWKLEFEASFDHLLLSSYVLTVYDSRTHAVVLTRNIGKPLLGLGWLISVDVDAIIDPLPSGSYDVTVTAVDSDGSAPSQPFYLTK
jgi:regulation of enolase protein 1 (concanavalin A-like superfamily)